MCILGGVTADISGYTRDEIYVAPLYPCEAQGSHKCVFKRMIWFNCGMGIEECSYSSMVNYSKHSAWLNYFSLTKTHLHCRAAMFYHYYEKITFIQKVVFNAAHAHMIKDMCCFWCLQFVTISLHYCGVKIKFAKISSFQISIQKFSELRSSWLKPTIAIIAYLCRQYKHNTGCDDETWTVYCG